MFWNTISLYQTLSKYIVDLLKQINMEQAKSCTTVAIMGIQVSNSSGSLNNEKLYHKSQPWGAVQYFIDYLTRNILFCEKYNFHSKE